MCLCGVCMSDIHGDQKRALDPPELQLQMILSLQVGAENQTQVLWEID